MTIIVIILFFVIEAVGLIFIFQNTKWGIFQKGAIKWPSRVIFGLLFTLLLMAVVKKHALDFMRVSGKSMENYLYENDLVTVNKIAHKIEGIKKGNVYIFQDAEGILSIKRCIAVSGDLIRIEKGEVFVNGQREQSGNYVKQKFDVFLDDDLGFATLLKSMNVHGARPINQGSYQYGYELYLTGLQKAKIETFDYLAILNKSEDSASETLEKYPHLLSFNRESLNEMAVPQDSDGKIEYAFLMGDNRDNSIDSRWLGFISSEDIIGRVDWVIK